MPAPLDRAHLETRLRRLLSSREPAPARVLYSELSISQASFSRLVSSLGADIVTLGRGRSRRYAWRRDITGITAPIPIYEVGPAGEGARRLARMVPIQPDGFVVRFEDGQEEVSPDLPYFLHDLRPAGFLGRLIPLRTPELGLPPDIRSWSADHTLRFLTEHGWNQVGAFIVGDAAYRKYLDDTLEAADLVPAEERAERYPERATDVLKLGPPGSSAAGEQPKFLATRADPDGQQVPVLVKFSAPADSPANQRVADLLVAEHLALQVLAAHGFEAARSEILQAGGRTFLEVERFDRVGLRHRVGQLSLEALDAQFAARTERTWIASVHTLAEAGVVPAAVADSVRALHLFGELIGNTDMHFGNLSFRLRGTTVTGLAPAYDMTPMRYAPKAGEVIEVPFQPRVPGPEASDIAPVVVGAAQDFWQRAARHPAIHRSFRAIAAGNAGALQRIRDALSFLPEPAPRPRS